MKTCPNCGTQAESAFCPTCGANLAEGTAPQQPEAAYPYEQNAYQQNQYQYQENNYTQPSSGTWSPKVTGIVAYITWIGLILALVVGDKRGAIFHINQALVINIATVIVSVVTIIPILGWIVGFLGGIFTFVCWVMGLYYACTENEKEVPLLGRFKLLQ